MRLDTEAGADAATADPGKSALATAAQLGMPLLDLSAFDPAALALDVVDQDFARRHNALPLTKRGDRLFVAVADAASLGAVDEIRFRTGIPTEPVLAARDQIATTLASYRSGGDALLAELEDETDASTRANGPEGEAVGEAPVVRYVHDVLREAVASGASDIHFEPYDNSYRIRMRIDGILGQVRQPPARLGARFASRLKVMAQLDVTERRIPQDGRIRLANPDGSAVDFRASTLPALHGEKVVLRILDTSSARMSIDQLGLDAEQKRLYLDALGRPQGMILVTGPTGSGKTVTLYTGLNVLNAEHRNIATAEDPVEINVDGINQVQVNPKVGLDFATALRAFLRQDPDVVMVGEIRDLETAQTAIKAAQTGHLVLSTLHTNSAAQTLARLRSMGIPPYNLATSVTLIVAQRLARLLCRHCKRPVAVPREVLLAEGFDSADLAARQQLFEANEGGCEHCSHGYRGRTGIYEVMPLVPAMERLILADGDSAALAEQARALGYDDLRRAGLKKAMQGLTSLREINRVTARGGPGGNGARAMTEHVVFTWEGSDRFGRKVSGEIAGPAPRFVRSQLRRRGIVIRRIRRKQRTGAPRIGGRIKTADIALFSRQMATMMRTGIPLVQAFDLVASGTRNLRLANVIRSICSEVAAGASLAATLRRFPRQFDHMYCDLVAIGERSGTLDGMLDRIATCQEAAQATRRKLKKAMTYPLLVTTVAVLVTAILLIHVVPQFEAVFASVGTELPAFTLLVIGISDFLRDWWWALSGSITAAGFGLVAWHRRSTAFRNAIDRMALKTPIAGKMLGQAAVARCARNLATTVSAGVPLVEALGSVADATGNVVFTEAAHGIRDAVSAGQSLQSSLRESGIFPDMMVQMVAVGEESGSLDDMLGRVAEYFENQVDDAVDNITSFLEPLMMAVLGVLVGGLILAMYLPVFQLGSVFGQ